MNISDLLDKINKNENTALTENESKRILKAYGIPVTEETMAVDQIKNVGPGGQFLDQEYTLRNYRQHQWQPRMTVRMEWTEFQRLQGGRDMRQRANYEARRILETHHPNPLDELLAVELDRLAREKQAQAIKQFQLDG